jgi:hypothetical protein
MAMPIWGKFTKKAYEDPSTGLNVFDKFRKPNDFNDELLDCNKYYEKTNKNITDDQINFDQ